MTGLAMATAKKTSKTWPRTPFGESSSSTSAARRCRWLMDIEAGEEVWNFPVYAYEIHTDGTDDGQHSGVLTLCGWSTTACRRISWAARCGD